MPLSAPELLTARHDLTRFACGQPALDHWLKTRALANQEKGFTVVMVVHERPARGRLLRPGHPTAGDGRPHMTNCVFVLMPHRFQRRKMIIFHLNRYDEHLLSSP